MPNTYFTFKQFTVHHDKCAMKVGTDGVLIGAWTDLHDASHILDIGTGTGIISLMLAQRSSAHILAVDIDEGAVEQARINISASPWPGQITVRQADILQLSQLPEMENKFDVIVSNPPYFQEEVKCPEGQRNTARHTDTLTFDSLLQSASAMLRNNGTFSVVLPAAVAPDFITLALRHQLQLSRQTWVHTKEGKQPKRILMEFRKGRVEQTLTTHLNMVDLQGNRTPEYTTLVNDFYL